MTYIDNYLNWVKQNTVEEQLSDGWTEIATPFMDRHNDGLIIYAKEERGEITFSDDGYIIGDMEMSGINISRRMNSIKKFLSGYGVDINDKNELIVKATITNHPVKQHLMLQAMMAASDMFVPTSKNNSSTIFLEDVSNFFETNSIYPVKDVQVQGKSGYTHKIDFIITRSKTMPERYVYAINSPKMNNVKATLFMWEDIRSNRPENTKMIAMLNDNKKINEDSIQAFTNYKATPIRWSQRDNHIDEFQSA